MLKVTNLIVMSMLHMCWFIAQFKTAEEVEWIDPGDMIYYDHNTQTMKNRRDAEVWLFLKIFYVFRQCYSDDTALVKYLFSE